MDIRITLTPSQADLLFALKSAAGADNLSAEEYAQVLMDNALEGRTPRAATPSSTTPPPQDGGGVPAADTSQLYALMDHKGNELYVGPWDKVAQERSYYRDQGRPEWDMQVMRCRPWVVMHCASGRVVFRSSRRSCMGWVEIANKTDPGVYQVVPQVYPAKSERLQLRLTPGALAHLRALAVAQGRSMSDVIDRWLSSQPV